MDRLQFLIDWYSGGPKSAVENSLNIPIGIGTLLFGINPHLCWKSSDNELFSIRFLAPPDPPINSPLGIQLSLWDPASNVRKGIYDSSFFIMYL